MLINEIAVPSIGACLSSYIKNSSYLVRLGTQIVRHGHGATLHWRPVKLSLAD